MRTFVINLLRRPDRLSEITSDLAKHNVSFERVEAIDARQTHLVAPYRRPFLSSIYSPETMTDAYIANFLSHRVIWQRMVDEKIEQALILEDDAKISNWDPRFLELNISDYNLDILRLGATIEPTTTGKNFVTPTGGTILDRSLATGTSWDNVVQIVTLAGAKKCLKIRPYWFPSDHFEIYKKCFGVNYAIIMPLVWTDSQSPTDVPQIIQPYRNKFWLPRGLRRMHQKIKKFIRKKILLPAILFYYQKKYNDNQ